MRARYSTLLIFTVASVVTGFRDAAAQSARPGQHRVVIDSDVGPDDLMAIAFLLGRPDIHILGVTTVTGLTSSDTGARNVLRLLHLAGADSIPVYAGANTPLQFTTRFPRAWIASAEQLGADAAPAATRQPEKGSAAEFLARTLASSDARDGGIELLALGPLTNIALAIRKAGRGRVGPVRIVIMGGALDVPGNLVTPDSKSDNTKAEWNILADPLAAREVVQSPLAIDLVALDATVHVPITSCFVRALMSGPATPMRSYVGRILDSSREWIDRGDYFAWDPLAAVALVDPGVVQLAGAKVTVDTAPPYPGWTHRAPNGRRISVAVNAGRQRFLRVFDAGLGRRTGVLPGCK